MKVLAGIVCFFLLVPAVAAVRADDRRVSQEGRDETAREPVCRIYRAKKKGVPVYAQADLTAAVVGRLKLGEKVCYIGEQGKFAIVDLREHDRVNPEAADGASGKTWAAEVKTGAMIAYARLVDLWPPRDDPADPGRDNFVERLKQHYYYLRHGGVPENLFRSLFGTTPFEPACTAGEICEELDRCADDADCKEKARDPADR